MVTGGPSASNSAVSRARRSGLERTSATGPYTSRRAATAWARPASVSSASVRPNSRPCALATDSPWRTRISMTGAPGSGRDEDAAALLAGGDLSVGQGADLLDLARGQLEMAAAAVSAH